MQDRQATLLTESSKAWSMLHMLALFPGPAQLSIASSMVKQEKVLQATESWVGPGNKARICKTYTNPSLNPVLKAARQNLQHGDKSGSRGHHYGYALCLTWGKMKHFSAHGLLHCLELFHSSVLWRK